MRRAPEGFGVTGTGTSGGAACATTSGFNIGGTGTTSLSGGVEDRAVTGTCWGTTETGRSGTAGTSCNWNSGGPAEGSGRDALARTTAAGRMPP